MKRFLVHGICLCLLASALAAGLTGCRESLPETVNLSVNLGNGSTGRSAFESIPDPTITQYRISGTGPLESSFDVTTATTRTVIEGLYTGTWEITAQGMNQDGTVLVEAELSAKLSVDHSDVVLDLHPAPGDGRLELDLSWSGEEVNVYLVMVTYRRVDCPEAQEVTDYAISSGTSGTFHRTLPAGDYVIHFRAQDRTHGQVSDVMRTVNIYKDTATRGSVFINTEIPSVSGGFQIQDHLSPRLTGTLIGAPLVIYEGIPLQLSYVPHDPDLASLEDITTEWYLNGVKFRSVTGSLTEAIVPEPGYHKVEVLAFTPQQGSLASASLEFIAHDNSLTEDLMLVQSLIHGQDEILLSMVSDVITVPDGYVITASRGSGTIQVFNPIHDGSLELLYGIKDEHLKGVRSLSASPNGEFICALSDSTVSMYAYNPFSERYEHSYSLSGDLIPDGGKPIVNPSSVVFSPDGRNLYFSDIGTDEIHHLSWNTAELQYKGSAPAIDGLGLSSPRSLSVNSSGSYLASANTGNSSLQVFPVSEQGVLSQPQVFSFNYNRTMGISQITSTAFAEDGSLFTTSNNFLCHFGYNGEFFNTYRVKEGDFPECHMSGLRTVTIDEERGKLFTGNVTSRGITVFEFCDDFSLTFRSFTPCGPIHKMVIDPSGSYLYAISTTGHTLHVFDIR